MSFSRNSLRFITIKTLVLFYFILFILKSYSYIYIYTYSSMVKYSSLLLTLPNLKNLLKLHSCCLVLTFKLRELIYLISYLAS